MSTVLLTTEATRINANESAVLTATMYDTDSVQLAKAAILSVTLTIKHKKTGEIINSRDGSDVLDTDIGTLATDGTLTLKLTTADNAFVGDYTAGSESRTESHILAITWTWNDSDDDTLTGIQEYEVQVQRLP